jgi:DNA-binding transcriptional LysR family regulator
MEIRVLRYFLAVAQEESISKAAVALHVTQPTLSRQLAQLEEEIGARLFVRGARRFTLTDSGLLLRRRAQEVTALMDKTKLELAQREAQVAGQVSLGCGEFAGAQVLPELMRAFRQQYPLVTFDLFTASADEAKTRLDSGLLDAGLLLEPVEMDKYEYLRLPVQERWVVLVRPDDPLANSPGVTASDLARRPIILARRPAVQSLLAHWFGARYNRLNVVCTSNFATNAAVLVQGGLGCALTLEGAMPFWDQQKIRRIPLYPALYGSTVLAWRRGQPLGPAAARFLEYARAALKDGAAQADSTGMAGR